jgi:polar amino acid transport system substrate-binding protein
MSAPTSHRRGLACALSVAASAVLGLTACGPASGTKSAGQPTVPVDATLSKQVPAALRGKELKVATAATYPPMEFIDNDGKTIVGMEPEIVTAIGQVLGLKLTIVNASFDTIIPGLGSGKYDLAISSMNATPEREKVVSMVSVRTGGSSFVVRAGDGPKVETLGDLCGVKVAVSSGSTQLDDVKKQSAKCTAAGKPAPQILVFADQNQQFLALSSRRADVLAGGAPGNAWKVKESGGKFTLSGPAYDVETTAIALPKGSPLAQPVSDALNVLIKNGTYTKILHKWGEDVDGIALTKSQVNPAKPGQ